MKAAILVETGQPLIVDEITLLEPLKFGQVRVKIFYSSICGTQINEIYGAKGKDKFLPHLLGHEGVGVVEEIGEGVQFVKVGDTVILHWKTGKGIESQTPKYKWGNKIVNAGWVTTFNDEAVISENRLTVVSPEFKNISHKIAPLFGCAVTTAMGVINNDAKVKIGESVVIFGLGGVGINLVQAAAMVSANPIIGIDLHDEKLALAKKFGMTHGINVNKVANLQESLRSILNKAGAHVAIDTTGNTSLIELAYQITRSDGRTILVGVPKEGNNISIYSLPLHFGKVLTGSHGGQAKPDEDIPRYLQLLESGKMQLDGLITKEFSLDQINEAVALMKENAIAGRILIKMAK